MIKKQDDVIRRHRVSFDAFYVEKKKVQGEHFLMRNTFEHISEINLWGSSESLSGEGAKIFMSSEKIRVLDLQIFARV